MCSGLFFYQQSEKKFIKISSLWGIDNTALGCISSIKMPQFDYTSNK